MGEDPLFNSEPTANGTNKTAENAETSEEPTEIFVGSGDRGGGKENATVYVEGEPFVIDTETTARELKDMVGAADNEFLTFRNDDNDMPKHIADNELVLEKVDPGTKLECQPGTGPEGGMFG